MKKIKALVKRARWEEEITEVFFEIADVASPNTIKSLAADLTKDIKQINWSIYPGQHKYIIDVMSIIEVPLKTEGFMTASQTRKLRVGDAVKILVDGWGEDNEGEESSFEAGTIVTISDISYDNDQGLMITIITSTGISNCFDAQNYGGLYPFEPHGEYRIRRIEDNSVGMLIYPSKECAEAAKNQYQEDFGWECEIVPNLEVRA